MALKNKDGTVYKLRGPNPLMKDQKTWEEFRVHNMKWGSEILPDASEIHAIKTDFQVRNNFIDELDQAAAEVGKESDIKVVESPTISEPRVVLEPKSEITVVENKIVEAPRPENIEHSTIPKVFIHCLPAFLDKKIDDVYGDTVETLKYKSPFSFEGIILDQSDLTFKFWTESNDMTNQILQGSVLYPKTLQKRWWKVQERMEKTGGWIVTAHPSDYQPHFA